ncbi:MAG: beta-lactamase [Candidatus Aminicenantes bacterium]|nr:beta-lactamase [Candidatus Aminicenantes bacterium]
MNSLDMGIPTKPGSKCLEGEDRDEGGCHTIAPAIAAVFVLLFSSALMGRTARGDERIMQTQAIFSGLILDHEPGAAVLVVKDGGVVFERGYGVTDLRTRRRIDARTNFRLASVSKQFTAAAVMLLVRDGRIRYEDRLTDIFPDFPGYGRAITIRHLLNHTSGLPDYEDLMPPVDPSLPVAEVQIKDGGVLELLKGRQSGKFAPGTKWAYSNSGYVLLGLIVEKASGRRFSAFLHDRIFAPLKMTATAAHERGLDEVPDRALGHTKDGGVWREADQSPTSATLGDGGVYSSLSDLLKWDEALRGHTLLSEREMRPALEPVRVQDGTPTEPDGTPAAYGFGWFLNPWKGRARMWHYGETSGFRTAIQRFTEDRITVVVLCNRTDLDAGSLALEAAGFQLNAK